MIAADDEYVLTQSGKRNQKIIKERDSLRGGNVLIIDVAGKNDGIWLLGFCDGDNLFKNELLFIKHGVFVDSFTYVQVACMQYLHSYY